jgi:hypothetical protein
MTMHLHHPSLSLVGKKKGKIKFRNADEARRARELDASWKELQKRWDVDAEDKKRKRALSAEPLVYNLSVPSGRVTSSRIPSKVTAGHSTAPIHRVYTGDQVLGITIVHKSCLQPVFNQQEAIDAAQMRR